MSALLEVSGLSKHFGGLQAVKDVSFAIEPGEIVGILGPNGAGKTTLYNLLTGFIPFDSGSVVFKGLPTDGVAEVGYGIEDGSRGQGLATEATLACVEWALAQPGIIAVQAITFEGHLASLGVIKNCSMTPAGTREHPIFGELLVFERR